VKNKKPFEEYNKKRDFSFSPEPIGVIKEKGGQKKFVVQKHNATTLHYDLRLELEGVLKSWVVPKGPSMDPKVRRLAIPTEDHPIEYADFEGVIPKGNYGAGTVIVWDSGTFRNSKGEEKSFADNLEEGHATFHLNGSKLIGNFALIKTNRGKSRPQWLFFKMKDEYAIPGSEITSEKPNSSKTGRSLEEVEE
jgi:DNA ligase D-like protein (predicted 3'-phosphoesterase)